MSDKKIILHIHDVNFAKLYKNNYIKFYIILLYAEDNRKDTIYFHLDKSLNINLSTPFSDM